MTLAGCLALTCVVLGLIVLVLGWLLLRASRPTPPSVDVVAMDAASRELNREAAADTRAGVEERAHVSAVLERDRIARAKSPDDLGDLFEEAETQRTRIESGEEPPK